MTEPAGSHDLDLGALNHHGDDELAAGLLDLAVNVRPDPMPAWLSEAVIAASSRLSDYPDAGPARAALARFHGRDPSEVLITAGAAEAFTLIAHGIERGSALMVHPGFTEPEVALRAAGWPLERLLLNRADGFELPPVVRSDATLICIGNPTNPTGRLHPRDGLLRLRRPGRVLVVDEAFMDSVPGEPESLTGQADLTGMVITRSLTKTWGLAGLRIGYALADPAIIAAMAAVQPHWSVSTPALAALLACLSDEAVAESTRRADRVETEREYLRSGLAERGFEVPVGSRGPFLLARHGRHPDLHAQLREAGIAVRRADTFPGLEPGWIRIAARDVGSIDTLLEALDELGPFER
jgi:histidinol-phosphate aminotransferase